MKIRNKKTLVVTLILVTVVLAVSGIFVLTKSEVVSNSNTGNSPDTSSEDQQPTEDQNQKSNDDFKANLPSQNKKDSEEKQTNNGSASEKTVKPQITSYGLYNGSVEVGSRVPNVFEPNGTCTLTLTKGSARVEKSQSATPNVSEMSCGYLSISKGRLSNGTWSAVVSYESSSYSGLSDSVEVEVK